MMASEDVIELGSSDEESAKPAPKKRKTLQNAMVHIPNKLPSDLTVVPPKNFKSKINPVNVLKKTIGSAVTVTKVSKNKINPLTTIKNVNGSPTNFSIASKSNVGLKSNIQIPIQGPVIYPGKSIISGSNVAVINKPLVVASSSKTALNYAVNNVNIVRQLKPQVAQGKPLKVQGNLRLPSRNTTKLPPGITLKRAMPPSVKIGSKVSVKDLTPFKKTIRINPSAIIQAKSQKAMKGQSSVTAEVPTVNLDDDEPATASGHQWYLRPEEQEKNNAEDSDPLATKPDDLIANKTDDPLDGKLNGPKTILTEKLRKSLETDKSEGKKSLEEKQEGSAKSLSALETCSIQKQNNKEPDKNNFIEITIEDSPIKPNHNKKGFQVGAELAITIDDSPVRNKSGKTVLSCNSDDENIESSKEFNSRKKLEYPKIIEEMQVVEIEIEPLPVEINQSNQNNETEKTSEEQPTTEPFMDEKNSSPSIDTVKSKKSPKSDKESSSNEKTSVISNSKHKKEKLKAIADCMDIIEIEESPVKPLEETRTTTPQKNKQSKPTYKITQPIEIIDLDDKEKDEFTPTYRSFIKLCFQLENSDDMKKIVEKKIKAYYRQVPKEYTESDSFTDLVAGKILAMKTSPEKMYLYIKDVVDELNLQRKLTKTQPAKEKNEEQEKFLYGEESEFDAKRQRQIRKLEKTLKKLHRAIQKLEEEEVDFDDEEDSVYLLTESEDDTSSKDGRPQNKEVLLQRYKERSVRVHAKLCQLTNTKMPSEARVQIDPRPGQPKGPAKRLEKWINKKVPIGTPLPFPDFHDVLRCVREANKEDNIGWNEADIMEEARDLFVRCGKKLQRRRQENEWRLAASRVPSEAVDPAEDSSDLKRKLEENRRLASKKETEVFNKYADRQNQLKLEAVEIGDKEAEESPVESDDEVEEEVTNASSVSVSMTDKEKRKERIKSLLQKSKVNKDIDQNPDQTPVEKVDTTKDSNVSKPDDKNDTNAQESSEKDPITSNPSNKEGKDESDASDKGKSDNVESDIDELHLLQRREVQDNSSSDTGSAIAIDDTTSSCEKSSDDKEPAKQASDVISIENSSFSESEDKRGDLSEDTEKENLQTDKMNEDTGDNIETKCVTEIDLNKTDDKEKRAYLEDILLASTDDDSETSKSNPVNETCINLRDDSISIGDTMIIENTEIDGSGEEFKGDSNDKNTATDGSSVEGMEIGFTEDNSQDQRLSKTEYIAENYGNESAVKESNIETTIEKSPAEVHVSSENSNEIISLNSVETIEDDCAYQTGIDIVKSVSDDKDEEAIIGSEKPNERDTLLGKEVESSTKAKENVKNTPSNVNETTETKAKDDANIVSDEDNHIENDLKSKEQEISQHDQDTLKDKHNLIDKTDIAETSTSDSKKENLSVPSLDNTKEACVESVESTEQKTTGQNNGDTSSKETKSQINDINVNIDKINKIDETKDNNNSVPEAMEVDSLDETL